MRVRASELANLCAIFPSLRAGRISRPDLETYVQRSLLIDARSTAIEIVDASIQSGLLSLVGDDCVLTQPGKELAKRHNQMDVVVSPAAKEHILKSVYLNPALSGGHCSDFLLRLSVDMVRETFVYHRSEADDYEVLSALRMLSSVGFLDVDLDIAIVRKKYVSLANTVLLKVRSGRREVSDEKDDELNEVGKVAEEKAVEDEKRRLRTAGYAELAELVQRISLVDRSAGYDVLSYTGGGRDPAEKIHIEVKGTRGEEIGFVWTRNERYMANNLRKAYWIYVYTNVDISAPSASGPVCINDPIQALGRLGFVQEPLDVYVAKPARSRKKRAAR